MSCIDHRTSSRCWIADTDRGGRKHRSNSIEAALLSDAEQEAEDQPERGAYRYGTHLKLELGSVVKPIRVDAPASVPTVITGVREGGGGEDQDDRDPGPDERSRWQCFSSTSARRLRAGLALRR